MAVPGTETVTPGTGSPVLSTTVPLTATSTNAAFAWAGDPGSVSFSRNSCFVFPVKESARDRFRDNRKKHKMKKEYFPLPKHACRDSFIEMGFMLLLAKKNCPIINYDERACKKDLDPIG